MVAQLPIETGFYFPLAIDEDGNIYEELANELWQSAPGGKDLVLIGNGLSGPRDGVGAGRGQAGRGRAPGTSPPLQRHARSRWSAARR